MTAPNLKAPTTITGKVAPYPVTTSLAAALSNSAGSNQCLRISTIRLANTSGSAVTVSVSHYRSSTHTYLVKTANIAANQSLVVSQRDEFVYLEEGDAICAQASAATVDMLVTYDAWS
ncbi:MAG: hypothetical protein WCQ20_14880 [Synechococcaceae cyanobacterium ELA739]|jgi:hypothetical protein